MRTFRGSRKQRQKRRVKGKTQVFSIISKQLKKILQVEIPLPKWFHRKQQSKRNTQHRYLKRDVAKRNFRNPEKKKRANLNNVFDFFSEKRFVLASSVLGIVLLGWLSIIFLQPHFYLEKISVDGTIEIPQEALNEMVLQHINSRHWYGVKKSHRLFLGLNKLQDQILSSYSLDSIEFEPHWPSKSIAVVIKEKDPMIIYSVDDTYFTVDESGSIIREIDLQQYQERFANIPLIYQYEALETPEIGNQIITTGVIASINQISNELAEYDKFKVHSFRIKPSQQREVRIKKDVPKTIQEEEVQEDALEDDIEELTASIAEAGSLQEKISLLKQGITEITPERLEEGKVDELLAQEVVYAPNDGYQLNELEVYMENGWSLKLGHDVLDNDSSTSELLNIFATLNGEMDIEGEVKEYIDLRFKNRVYYR